MLLRILEKPIAEVDINLKKIMSENKSEPEKKLKKAIDNHLTLMSEYIDNVNIYLNEVRNLSKRNQRVYLRERKKYEKDFRKIVEELKAKGYFRGLDTKVITFGLLGMMNWVPKWYKRSGHLSIEDISNIFHLMVISNRNSNG